MENPSLHVRVGVHYYTQNGTIIKIDSVLEGQNYSNYQDMGFTFKDDGSHFYRPDGSSSGPIGSCLVAEVPSYSTTIMHNAKILEELGYLAAMGQVIRCIRIYRMVSGAGITEAKQAVEEAANDAKLKYQIPVTVSPDFVARNTAMREALITTRTLVSKCAESGFDEDDPVRELFINNGAISRVLGDRFSLIQKD